jgi:hypothetical protein
MARSSTNTLPPPQVGDTLRVRPAAARRDAGATGVVTRVRLSSGRWAAAELEIAGQRRWFLKGELELPQPTPPPAPVPAPPPAPAPPPQPRRVAPPADFLRIARRSRQGRRAPALFIYVGRALLARWRATAGPVQRVDLALEAGRLTIRAAPAGRYILDADSGRQPNFHCDGARDLVALPDGRYCATVDGAALVVGELIEGVA